MEREREIKMERERDIVLGDPQGRPPCANKRSTKNSDFNMLPQVLSLCCFTDTDTFLTLICDDDDGDDDNDVYYVVWYCRKRITTS
jgi:hypothetical protein